jgi:hypothetical protein
VRKFRDTLDSPISSHRKSYPQWGGAPSPGLGFSANRKSAGKGGRIMGGAGWDYHSGAGWTF